MAGLEDFISPSRPPNLQLRKTKELVPVGWLGGWNSEGTEVAAHVYRPTLRPGEKCFGHYASTKQPSCNTQFVVVFLTEETVPYIAFPSEFERLELVNFDDGSKQAEIVLFRPVSPRGFRALGDVAVSRHDLIEAEGDIRNIKFLKDVVCIAEEYCVPAVTGIPIWTEKNIDDYGACIEPVLPFSSVAVSATQGKNDTHALESVRAGCNLSLLLFSKGKGLHDGKSSDSLKGEEDGYSGVLVMAARTLAREFVDFHTTCRVRLVLHQNQRWYPVKGWGTTLATERDEWSGLTGCSSQPPIPLNPTQWHVDLSPYPDRCDHEGYFYGLNFPDLPENPTVFCGQPRPTHTTFVRRRRWIGPVVEYVQGDVLRYEEPEEKCRHEEDTSLVWDAPGPVQKMVEALRKRVHQSLGFAPS